MMNIYFIIFSTVAGAAVLICLAALLRARDERKRKGRESEEEEQREIRRQQNELLDGRSMLETFLKRFGHRKEFVSVINAIDAYLGKQEKSA